MKWPNVKSTIFWLLNHHYTATNCTWILTTSNTQAHIHSSSHTSQYLVAGTPAGADIHLHVLPHQASASVCTADTWVNPPIRVSAVVQQWMPAYLQHRQPGRLCAGYGNNICHKCSQHDLLPCISRMNCALNTASLLIALTQMSGTCRREADGWSPALCQSSLDSAHPSNTRPHCRSFLDAELETAGSSAVWLVTEWPNPAATGPITPNNIITRVT